MGSEPPRASSAACSYSVNAGSRSPSELSTSARSRATFARSSPALDEIVDEFRPNCVGLPQQTCGPRLVAGGDQFGRNLTNGEN